MNVEMKLGWTTGHDEPRAGKARVLVGPGGRWVVMACNPTQRPIELGATRTVGACRGHGPPCRPQFRCPTTSESDN